HLPTSSPTPYLHPSPHRPALHPFPTRRSSDLIQARPPLVALLDRRREHEVHLELALIRVGQNLNEERPNVVCQQLLAAQTPRSRSEEHTSELQSRFDLVCRLLLEKKNIIMVLT